MNKQFFKVVLLFLVFGVGNSFAQVGDTISGSVSDSLAKTPIDSVAVSSEGAVTKTSTSGVFNLVIPSTSIGNAVPKAISWDPIRHNFWWSGNLRNVSMEVRNLSGRLIAGYKNDDFSNRFTIANLPRGVYLATIRAASSVEVVKILKVRTGAIDESNIVSRISGSGQFAKPLATSKEHIVVFRKIGYNLAVITVPANTSSTPALLVKILKAKYNSPFDPSTIPNIMPLFDGRTMTGWNYNPSGWKVDNGCITGNGASSGQFCASKENFSEFRLFVSGIQVTGQHAGIGVAGVTPAPVGTWDNLQLKFHDLMTPSRYFWDYYINSGDDAGTTKSIDMDKPPYSVGWQGSFWQVEMLVNLKQGTIHAAMNGVDFVTHKFGPHNGTTGPVGLQSHGGNVEVRYKDIWIEVNPKQPDVLLSVKK